MSEVEIEFPRIEDFQDVEKLLKHKVDNAQLLLANTAGITVVNNARIFEFSK